MSNDPYLLDTRAVCKRYQISRVTLFRRLTSNEFPRPTHPGRPHQWLESVLDLFDQRCVEKSLKRLDRNPVRSFLRD
jgi:predicted DNA-binding transcriptional regulator AlpA